MNSTDLDGVIGFRLNGAEEASGASVSGGGDINGDGIDDLIIGAYRAAPGGHDRAGSTYVVFGSNAGFDPAIELGDLALSEGSQGFRLDGEAAFDASGRSVGNAGDVNGDGIDDLVIGALYADPNNRSNAGSVYVVFGRNDGFAAVTNLGGLAASEGFRLDGAAAGDFAGVSVSAAGDVNGDGIDDLIIGADGADPNGRNDAGSSYVIFGRDDGFDPVIDLRDLAAGDGFRIDGAAAGDFAGVSVSNAGDVDGDGIDDLIVGAYGARPNGLGRAGSSYVVFGRDDGFDPVIDLGNMAAGDGFRIDGAAGYDFSGISVSGAGDVDGDGIDDLIIGAPYADPNGLNAAGSSYVVFGRTDGFAAVMNLGDMTIGDGFRLDGTEEDDASGSSVSAAGDINGDGIDDLIVGARRATSDGFQAGSSFVVFGRSGSVAGPVALEALNGRDGFRFNGTERFESTGISASGVGDVNGDGIPDLVIGSAWTLGDSSSYVIFGSVDEPDAGTISVAASADRIDFGTPLLSGSTIQQSITLRNTGTLPASLGSVAREGSSEFAISSDSCGGTVLGTDAGINDSCRIDISVSIDQPGHFQARLVVPYDSPLGPVIVGLEVFPDGIFIDDLEAQPGAGEL